MNALKEDNGSQNERGLLHEISTGGNFSSFIIYCLFTIYIFIIAVYSTTDLDLLKAESVVVLPILNNPKIPLTHFYWFISPLVVIFHFYLLHRREGYENKIKQWKKDGKQCPSNFFGIPPEPRIQGMLLIFFANVAFFFLGPFCLLYIQWRFSNYQSLGISSVHFLCLVVVVVALFYNREFKFSVKKTTLILILLCGTLNYSIVGMLYFEKTRDILLETKASTLWLIPKLKLEADLKLEANLKLIGRRLMFADMEKAQLQGAEMKGAQLQGANMEKAQLRGADMEEAQLQGANMKEAQLWGAIMKKARLPAANMEKAQLWGADMEEAQLQRANMKEAQLWGAIMKKARLQRANMKEAQLWGAIMKKARLPAANMEKAQLWGADMEGAWLQGAIMEKAQLGAIMEEAQLDAIMKEAQLWVANMKEAQLWVAIMKKARLQGANMKEARLQGANMKEARLQGANLQGANMEKAQLWGADMEGAWLQGANMEKAQLWFANMKEARLQSANMKEAQLWGADMEKAQLQGADMEKAQLRVANMKEAQLQGADMEKAGLKDADMEGADLRGAYIKEAEFDEANIKETVFNGSFCAPEISGSFFDRVNGRIKKPGLVGCKYKGNKRWKRKLPPKDACMIIKNWKEGVKGVPRLNDAFTNWLNMADINLELKKCLMMR